MQKELANLWFKPYTPFVILALLIGGIYLFIYPLFQKAVNPNPVNPFPTPSITQTQVLGTDANSNLSTVERVGKLILLPTDEEPQIIPIADALKLKDQPFFKNARDGNILLIYSKNKKAILYDPQVNQIINVAPLSDPQPQQQQPTQEPAFLPEKPASISATPAASPSATPAP